MQQIPKIYFGNKTKKDDEIPEEEEIPIFSSPETEVAIETIKNEVFEKLSRQKYLTDYSICKYSNQNFRVKSKIIF